MKQAFQKVVQHIYFGCQPRVTYPSLGEEELEERPAPASLRKPSIIVACGSLFVASLLRETIFDQVDGRMFDEADWIRQKDPF